ncbi:hypothetical protein SAMN05421846_101225 [Chryseobacterium taeanense]|uniref:Uncharacterized protein n=1 Tax=Chryseobacterium taeanense TaxID=311334 RepID=A0A1G8DLE9_9FLAO|nr:hypothetical protein [Chryseobacterium taeanense]SDH58487.1 hypothetical protein SAMN05421846_101225 [Chryseobacterium taeanense]
MIKINELRFNNCVSKNGEEKILRVNLYILQNILYGNSENYQPIKLDDSWFHKFGFEINHVGFTDSNLSYITLAEFINLENYYILRLAQNQISVKIEYVHELQNLYFTLTNCELELKERI